MWFSSELENDDVLAFLDIKVIRSNGCFLTSVYRKPTFSGVYTNYNSFLPEIYKTGLVQTLLFRLFTICSNWSLVHKEIEFLKAVMRKNSYPDRLLDSVIHRFLSGIFVASFLKRSQPHSRKESINFQINRFHAGGSSRLSQ